MVFSTTCMHLQVDLIASLFGHPTRLYASSTWDYLHYCRARLLTIFHCNNKNSLQFDCSTQQINNNTTNIQYSHLNLQSILWQQKLHCSQKNDLKYNRPFPSYLLPHFQSESLCETMKMKMTLICKKVDVKVEHIFI